MIVRKEKSQPVKGNRSKRARRHVSLFHGTTPGTTVPASALSEPKLPPWVGE
jgi:hypothetical protein